MRVASQPRMVLVTAAALLPLALTSCGLLGPKIDHEAIAAEAAAKSRERVQNYLDAMKTKDPNLGREQLCEVLRPSFDTAATSPNGDFADHFTVTDAIITEVRANGGEQEIDAAVTVSAAGQDSAINLRFTVRKIGEQWCIADEVPVEGSAGTPSTAP
ncbi:MAG TPA: hypothetical protein VFX61_18270 [Micromonosporaceae bacterium]|nr:hypothetical protein [Micromonosporaceae bacterium]